MNKERMLMLADLLEEIKEHQFNIEYWVSDYDPESGEYVVDDSASDIVDYSVYKCESAACIAGWAVALKNDMKVSEQDVTEIEEKAADYLGLTTWEAKKLFYFDTRSIWNERADELGYQREHYLAHQVKAVDAAFAIRRIVDGEWSLS